MKPSAIDNYNTLAIIPARGGSKGIPRKNIKPLAGKPLIAWTIETALKTPCIDRVIVSTDDKEIAEIAKNYGAEAPFLRPAVFAEDSSTDLPVYQHAVDWLIENEKYQPDIIVWLRPTAPLRSCQDIEEARRKLIETQADWVRTVCHVEHHPYWVFKNGSNDKLIPFVENIKIEEYLRRQLLPEAFRLNGAVDVTWCETVMEKKLLYSGDVRGQIMKSEHSVDIDNDLDFILAEILMKRRAD